MCLQARHVLDESPHACRVDPVGKQGSEEIGSECKRYTDPHPRSGQPEHGNRGRRYERNRGSRNQRDYRERCRPMAAFGRAHVAAATITCHRSYKQP